MPDRGTESPGLNSSPTDAVIYVTPRFDYSYALLVEQLAKVRDAFPLQNGS
jgi:hypothetical protein